MANKFLVLWKLELSRVSAATMQTVLRQQEYGAHLQTEGKVQARYHLIGAHGGAWIYDVANYEILPLAEMHGPTPLGTKEPE
jgi:hypothetical protein